MGDFDIDENFFSASFKALKASAIQMAWIINQLSKNFNSRPCKIL